MARDARDENDREPRWTSTGYWTDRGDDQDWQGDPSRARDYGRDDMRRYARRSEEQGERLRSLRGQRGGPRHETWDSQLDTDEVGIHDDHALDFEDERGRAWGYDTDLPRDFQQRRRNRDRVIEQRPRGEEQPARRPYDRNPNRPQGNRDWDRFQIQPASEQRRHFLEPGARRGAFGDRYPDEYRGDNLVDNYWGSHEQRRDYRDRDRGAWWNNTQGRPDVTSARRTGGSLPTQPAYDWLEDEDYSVDLGFQYEFGTDFDFMNDVPGRNAGEGNRRQGGKSRRPGSGRSGSGRSGSGRSGRNASSGQQGSSQGSGTWGEFQYGWQGTPYRQQARYREFWNIPGPFTGMGPSNYQRPDHLIEEEICELFAQNGQIDSSGIEVQVQNGEVTLNGSVDRKRAKYLAEDIASEVTGVNDINNHIRVQANDGARTRGMGQEDIVQVGRIVPGMRVAGLHGKHIGTVKEVRQDGFLLDRVEGKNTFIPFRAVKRTNGQIILHVTVNEIDQQGWKTE